MDPNSCLSVPCPAPGMPWLQVQVRKPPTSHGEPGRWAWLALPAVLCRTMGGGSEPQRQHLCSSPLQRNTAVWQLHPGPSQDDGGVRGPVLSASDGRGTHPPLLSSGKRDTAPSPVRGPWVCSAAKFPWACGQSVAGPGREAGKEQDADKGRVLAIGSPWGESIPRKFVGESPGVKRRCNTLVGNSRINSSTERAFEKVDGAAINKSQLPPINQLLLLFPSPRAPSRSRAESEEINKSRG